VFDGTDFAPRHPLTGGESPGESTMTAVLMTIGMVVVTCAIALVLDCAGVRAGCIGGDEALCNLPGLLGP
jgi:hypothetical protein